MLKFRLLALAALVSFALGAYQRATAQEEDATPEQGTQAEQTSPAQPEFQPLIFRPEGEVIIPESSVVHPEDAGIRMHTNHLIFVPAGRPLASAKPDFTFAETPASMGCVYGVGPIYAGCNPATGGTNHPSGGWGAIAIVDAYDNPNAASDLAFFSSYFGLPAATFTKVYANTSFGTLNGMNASCSGVPPGNVGWGGEEDLDIEWAHAMAPAAQIILVEACSASGSDLFFAEQVAGIKVDAAGGGDISNSWGGGEFAGEVGTTDDVFYRYHPKRITYFASAGDSGWGAQYPSSSPWVVSAGGTTINRDANGNFVNESCWSGSGGGVSVYELWQNPPSILNGMGPWSGFQYELFGGYPYQTAPRVTPDIALDADPASGAYVYDTYGYGGWMVVGGTSLASPALAGIINLSNNRLGQAPPGGGKFYTGENDLLYSQLNTKTAYPKNFYDVTTGSNGSGHNAAVGYDQCTGIGSPRGKLGK
jgi:subtilase family serine protease